MSHHSPGRIVGKMHNAMLQQAIEAAAHSSENKTEIVKEMVA